MSDPFESLSDDVIWLILNHLSNPQRCKIAIVCKSFYKSIKSFKNTSITLKWRDKYDNHVSAFSHNGSNQLNDESPLLQINRDHFEHYHGNLLKFKFNRLGQRQPWARSYDIYGKIDNNKLTLYTKNEDLYLYVNDFIDLNWNVNKLKKNDKYHDFLSKYEMGRIN